MSQSNQKPVHSNMHNTVNALITDNIDLWTSAIKKRNATGRGSNKKIELSGIKKLRELILELAVRGKLVPQDASDEPASVLLERIAEEKAQLIADKTIKKPKVLPEISNEEKPFELPHGWMWTRLGDSGDTNVGLTYSPKDAGDVGTPVLRSTNVQKGKIDLNELVRVDMKVKASAYVHEGDLLICARNGSKALVGKTASIPSLSEPMAFGAFMAIYRSPFNKYFEKFINSPVFRRNLTGVDTTTINQITQGNLRSTIAPVPPLPEQQRIVAKVDELMLLCDQLERQTEQSLSAHQTLVEVLLAALTDSDSAVSVKESFQTNWQRLAEHFDVLFTTEASIEQLKQTILQLAVMGKLVPQNPNDEPASVLLEKIAKEKARLIADKKIKKQKPLPEISDEEKMFELPSGWLFSHMQDLCSLITDGTHQTPKYSETGRPFISAQCVKPFRFMPENCRYVSEVHYQNYIKNRKPDLGDVLLSRVGAGIGEAAKIDTDLAFAIYVSTGLLKPLQEFLLSDYLVLWLNSPIGRGYSERNTLGKGVSQGNLNLSLIRAFVVSIPPLPEQHRIVAKVDELMTLCDQLKTRLADAQTTQVHLADAVVARSLK